MIIILLCSLHLWFSSTSGCAHDSSEPLLVTPLIESGEIRLAIEKSAVTLPGVENVQSYSGFFTTDKEKGYHLFFWFFPARKTSGRTPLILWLQGGPGTPSAPSAFLENGPFRLDENLKIHPEINTWTEKASVLYIDNPVGTGFSFMSNSSDYVKSLDEVIDNLVSALSQFFKLFTWRRQNPFYLTGVSYAAKYVSLLFCKLLKKNNYLRLNLQGIAFGNGFVDPWNMFVQHEIMHELGLIDTKLRKELDATKVELIKNANDKDKTTVVLFDLFLAYTRLQEASGLATFFDLRNTKDCPDDTYPTLYLKQPSIASALHAGNLFFNEHDNVTSDVRLALKETALISVVPQLETILEQGFKVLIYTGNMDLLVPYRAVENYLKVMKWSGAEEFKNADRKIWKIANKSDVIGYVRNVGNFTEVLIRNAGHFATYNQREYGKIMMENFIFDKPFV